MKKLLIISLLIPNIVFAFETMTEREKLRMKAHSKTSIAFISPQVRERLWFKRERITFAPHLNLKVDNYTKRMLVGFRAAMINNIKKNGRNYDNYFNADAFMSR